MYSHFKPELRRQVSVMELAASGNPGQPDYKVGLPQLLDPTFPDIIPSDGETIEVWGVVTSSITRLVKI